MNEKRMANWKELLEMRKEVVSEDEYKEILKKYKMENFDPKFTEMQHRIITSRAEKLAQSVIWNGGTKDEVKTVILNTMICMDSMKHKLDWRKWQKDNSIAPLTMKYMVKIVEA